MPMHTRFPVLVSFGSTFALLAACGGGTPPAPAAAPSTDAPPPSDVVAPGTVSSAAPAAEPAAPSAASKRPLDITNTCNEAAKIFVGDDPKSTSAPPDAKRTVEIGGTIPLNRRNDGTQTVWLLDASGAPLIKVSITKGMKHVEVGKSCRTLDAR